MSTPTIVVHGGCWSPPAGTVRDTGPAEAALAEAVDAAANALTRGGSAIDAAQAAVESLEDAPQFNAGRGSTLTADGGVEMDAAVMTGADGRAGAVAAVTAVRHPIALARAVMEGTPHVLIAGVGAERIAAEHGLEQMPPDWFVTERQRQAWRKRHGEGPRGTVGAVVLDAGGGLAAATSTGGTPGQLSGRVGDSPLIGAGTWADSRCAISCTGDGEHIIRRAGAHSAAMLVESGLSLGEACERVIVARLAGADAGLIAVDAEGNIALPFNTTLMNRAWRSGEGPTTTAVWSHDPAG